jgi:hypothetical protein
MEREVVMEDEKRKLLTTSEYPAFMTMLAELTTPVGFWEPGLKELIDPKRQQVTLSRWGDEVMMKMPGLPGTPYITLWEPEVKMIEQLHDVTWEELPDVEGGRP